MATLRRLLATHPEYARADEATFYLARALEVSGEENAATAEYTRLVKVYPDSAWAPDAYVLIGEHYFERNEAYKALLAYQRAAQAPGFTKAEFATFKLAWCYYLVGEYHRAIATMKPVAATAAQPELRAAAREDLTRFYADAGALDDADVFFRSIGEPERIPQASLRLAGIYAEQGKLEQAISLYRKVLEGDTAPDAHEGIVAAYTRQGRLDLALAELDRMRATFPAGVRRAPGFDRATTERARALIEAALAAVGERADQEALARGDDPRASRARETAERAYRGYLEEFPEGPHAYEAHVVLAEIAAAAGRPTEADAALVAAGRVAPAGGTAVGLRAGALLLDGGRPTEAARHLLPALRAAPTTPGAPDLALRLLDALAAASATRAERRARAAILAIPDLGDAAFRASVAAGR